MDKGRCSIQWKGTSCCLDIVCPGCEKFFHICPDMPFSGAVKCPACDGVWLCSPNIKLEPVQVSDHWARQYAVTEDDDLDDIDSGPFIV